VLEWNSAGTAVSFLRENEKSQVVYRAGIEQPIEERPYSSLESQVIAVDSIGARDVVRSSVVASSPGLPAPKQALAGAIPEAAIEGTPSVAETRIPFSLETRNGTQIIGDNLLGIGSITAKSTTGERELSHGQLLDTTAKGVLVREVTANATVVSYVDFNGQSTAVASTALATYGLPLASSVVTQGGSSYPSPGNCAVADHSGSMAFAYDLQSSTAGAHVMSPAAGLVAYVRTNVSCNSCDTNSCTMYSSTCSGDASNYGWGNVAIIQHADGTYSKITHLEPNSIQVAVGDNIAAGRYIGRQGSTGCTVGNLQGCGSHVHIQQQTTASLSGNSIQITFTDVASNPLACGRTYTSGLTETTGGSTSSVVDLSNNQTVSGTLARGQQAVYRINVPTGATLLRWEMTGSGDADLYTKAGSAPTLTSYDCRPYLSSSNETCEKINPAPGYQYALVYGYATSSSYMLKVTYTTSTNQTGTIYVRATLDGVSWSGPLSFTFGSLSSPDGTSVPATLTNRAAGGYGIRYISGGPSGANLDGILPSTFQDLPAGGSVTWTFAFKSAPRGLITVDATLDGSSWVGPMTVNVTGPTPATTTYAPTALSARSLGTYTATYVSGGPSNSRLVSFTPSATQPLGATGIRFTFNFASSLRINSISPTQVLVSVPTVLTVSTVNARSPIRAFVTTSYGTFEIAQAGIWVDSSSQVRVQVTMGGSTLPMTATLRLQNPDGQSATGTFQVVAPPPTIYSIVPSTVRLNQTTILTVNGANFRSPVRVFVITSSGTYEIASVGITFVSSNQLRVSVRMGGTTSYSAQLRVVNADGQSATSSFYVTP
jgi:murein DD-endopeptidase MepM/ murein hydrolase activator NlpD